MDAQTAALAILPPLFAVALEYINPVSGTYVRAGARNLLDDKKILDKNDEYFSTAADLVRDFAIGTMIANGVWPTIIGILAAFIALGFEFHKAPSLVFGSLLVVLCVISIAGLACGTRLLMSTSLEDLGGATLPPTDKDLRLSSPGAERTTYAKRMHRIIVGLNVVLIVSTIMVWCLT